MVIGRADSVFLARGALEIEPPVANEARISEQTFSRDLVFYINPSIWMTSAAFTESFFDGILSQSRTHNGAHKKWFDVLK